MSILDSIQRQIPPIHKEGYPFIGIFALVSLILFWLWSPLGWIGGICPRMESEMDIFEISRLLGVISLSPGGRGRRPFRRAGED